MIAYAALGSNLGDRERNLLRAIKLLQALPGIAVERMSSIYETEPVGFSEQPCFLNAVIELNTELGAKELLRNFLHIERRLGRLRAQMRWGPRTIDLDLLYYGRALIREPQLRVPHPRVAERKFVLVPLAEIAPDFIAPDRQKSIAELLIACKDDSAVVSYAPKLVNLWRQLVIEFRGAGEISRAAP